MTALALSHPARRLACLGLAVGAAAAVAQTGVGHAALRRAGLERPAAAYTEAVLRRAAVAGATPATARVGLEVAIHDAGPRALRYRYAVAVAPLGAAAASAGSGRVAVGAGATAVVRATAPLRCGAAPRAYVSVTVEPQPGRSVGAWVACPQRAPRKGATP